MTVDSDDIVTFWKNEKKNIEINRRGAAELIFHPISHGQLRSKKGKKKIPQISSSLSVASNLTNWYEPKDQPPQNTKNKKKKNTNFSLNFSDDLIKWQLSRSQQKSPHLQLEIDFFFFIFLFSRSIAIGHTTRS